MSREIKLARVCLDTDLRSSFDGLKRYLLKEFKIDASKLNPDSLIVFINRKATAFKMLSGSDYLVYYRNGHRRIPLDAIQYLPARFGGTQIEFNQAVRRSLMTKLKVDQ